MAPGERVLVAVSGGVDSMVLLYVLHVLNYDVRVAHFDHLTREGASTEDAAFVARLAKRFCLPCESGRWVDWPEHDAENSFEMEARARRYAFLVACAKQSGCPVIALGHHADDQAETVLMRALRGTSASGITGMAPKRERDGVRIVRPLLSARREEIRAWALASRITWREDASNADTSFERNWVRAKLLPLVEKRFNPRATEALARAAESLCVEDALMRELTREAVARTWRTPNLLRTPFLELHEALQRRVLEEVFRAKNLKVSYQAILRANAFIKAGAPGQLFSVGKNAFLTVQGAEVRFSRRLLEKPANVLLTVPGEASFLGLRFRAWIERVRPAGPIAVNCGPRRQLFDAEKLGLALVLRTREDGDAFMPLGLGHRKKLQDYFVDRHVPRDERDSTALVTTGEEIAWVVGHVPSATFAVTPDTRHFAVVEVEPCA